jgi:hypothetical protein
VRISSYKNPEGNLSYIDLYTMENKRDVASYVINPDKVNLTGDDFRYYRAVPTDVEIPPKMYPFLSTGMLKTSIYYDGNLKDYINPLLSTGAYSYPYSIRTISNLQQNTYCYSDISTLSNKEFKLQSYKFSSFNPSLEIVKRILLPATNDRVPTHTFYYANGGDFYYNSTREKLSFYEISRTLQENSSVLIPNIKTVDSSGTTIENKLMFRVVSPDKFYQQVDYAPVPDEDKPSELYSYSVIGAKLQADNNPQYLYRYQGNFIPKMRDVFFFGSREEKEMALEYNNDFKLGNTLLSENLTNTYYLRNQYFSKVADEEILRIDQNSGYKSIYPLVNEISIDRRDLFAWNSTWDKDYYQKYSTVSSFQKTNGTAEMREIKSFLGSKMIKLQKEFSLYEFIISGESPEILYTQEGDLVKIEIDIYAKFLRELLGTETEERVRKEFIAVSNRMPSVISPDQIDALAKSYIEKNILSLFEINRVNFYVLQTGNKGTLPDQAERPLIQSNETAGVFSTLSEPELIANKYIQRKDVKTAILSDLKLKIEIPLDSRYYTSVGFGVNVKRI